MKKIIILSILIFSISCLWCTNEVNAAQYCTLHFSRKMAMRKTGTTATCTKSGVNTYTCLLCKVIGRTTTKIETQNAFGHDWNSDHTCTRCSKNMNGHWFKLSGSYYKCIVCSKALTITGFSPNLSYKTGYRVSPYDNPTYFTGNVKVTFNEVPYDSNGNLMTVKGISTRYIAHNAKYHWGTDIPARNILRTVFPPVYMGGKGIDLRNTYTSTTKAKKTVTLATAPTAGKYVFSVTVNGVKMGSDRRYIKGSVSDDDKPTPETNESILTIKHINVNTGKEIIDKEYSKEVKFTGSEILAYSLPIDTIVGYKNYSNVSYKIGDADEVLATTNNQYIVKVPNSKSDTTITFYYSSPELTAKHIIESTNQEIVDKELTLEECMTRPSNIVFSLDTNNKYPILELIGYSLDGERINVSSKNQYAVTIPWNGKNRDIIFYYKYSDVKVNVIEKHIDSTTGELMKGTTIGKYSGDNIPLSLKSLDLNKFEGYENSGVYIGGKYQKRTGKTQYTISVDISQINYSTDYIIEFYYTSKDGKTYTYEMMDAIPESLESDEISKIASNEINKEKYDVEKAIPTSENLYANVRVHNYLLKYSYNKITDTVASKVTFVQPYICNGENKNVTTVYEVPVNATYYKLNYLEVYEVDSAELINKVLPGGSVVLTPKEKTAPAIVYNVPESYISYNKELNKTITLPTLEVPDMKYVKNIVGSDEYARHEAVEVANVRNDELIIDGQVITSSDWKSSFTEAPNEIIPSIMDETILYKNGYTISSTNMNGVYNSTGSIKYKRIKNINGNSSDSVTQKLTPNPVVVHTPVVNNLTLDNSSALMFNQKIGKLAVNSEGTTAKALVLDEEFIVKIPNTGTHINERGYGNRVYNIGQGVNSNSYAKLKEIKFPFDVYIVNGSKKELINANTWYTLPLKEESYKFILSKSAKEGAYDIDGNEYYIETRVVAENSFENKNIDITQYKANTNIEKSVATNRVFVEVIGRVYDLTITNTTDPKWQLENDLKVEEQPVGQACEMNSKYRYALKLGYSVLFNLKTKGEKSNEVLMTPKYFYIDKDTGEVKEVDLYYHTTAQKYVKLNENKILTDAKFSDYIGVWNGEYKLPSSTLAVEKGTALPGNVTDSNEVFLKNGYILVQFDVETKYNSWNYLSYDKPDINTQWQKENAKQKITLPNGKEVTINGIGNFVLYEANVRSSSDYESGGTH